MKICVYGASSSRLDEIYYAEAEKAGRLIAQRGHALVFGAGSEGVMGAAARGAASAGGEIIGIVPRFFDEPGIIYGGCTRLIFTETLGERKQLMLESSDACLALPGGLGTYEELFETMTMKQLWQNERAVALVNTCGCYDAFDALMRDSVRRGFMSEGCLALYTLCKTPEEALDVIESYVPRERNGRGLRDYSK